MLNYHHCSPILKGEQAYFCTSEVQKYEEVPRSTKKYQEVRKKYGRSTLPSLIFTRKQNKSFLLSTNAKNSVPKKRTKMFCYWKMSKILFPKTEHFCSVLGTEVPRSTEKYQEVPRSTKKYEEVQKYACSPLSVRLYIIYVLKFYLI